MNLWMTKIARVVRRESIYVAACSSSRWRTYIVEHAAVDSAASFKLETNNIDREKQKNLPALTIRQAKISSYRTFSQTSPSLELQNSENNDLRLDVDIKTDTTT